MALLLSKSENSAKSVSAFFVRHHATTMTATIKSTETPFVRARELRFPAQKVAARLMQAHDEARKAVSCRVERYKRGQLQRRARSGPSGYSAKTATDIDATDGDVDVCGRVEKGVTAEKEQPSSYSAKRNILLRLL